MTFDPISYVYVPTVPRSKITKPGHGIAKNLNTARTNQHIQPGATMLDTERPPVAEDGDENRYNESKAEAESATASSDEDESFPPIKDILCRALRKRDLGAVGEHCSMANADLGEGEEALPSQRDKAICNSTSTPATNVGNTQDDPIVVADDSNLSENAESDFWSGSIGAGSGETEASPFSPATTPGPRDSATPCLDLDAAEFGSSAAAPVLGVLNENDTLALIPDSQGDNFDKDTQLQSDTGGEGDGGSGSGNTSPYQRDRAALLVAEGLVNAQSDNDDNEDNEDESSCGHIETDSDDEFDGRDAGSNGSAKMPRSAKRKQPSSHASGLVQKRSRRLQTSTSYSRARLDGARRSDRSVISHNGHSTGNMERDTKSGLPSPVPSIAHTAGTDMSSRKSDLVLPSLDNLPTLTEITFRPRSPHSCAFTAVIRDGRGGNGVSFTQLAQLIRGVGYVGELDDFTIKPLQQGSLFLTGICHDPASQLLPGCSPTLPRNLSAHTPSSRVVRTQHVHGRPLRAFVERRSTAEISDNDSLSDSGSDTSK
ncbi:hypothetical protein VE02_10294 [Pseudogymnoascus sp. 03VT05]|nr:hypothetical protein VE02_10294 [Pseudogymnoascus sp. 03VT05]